eukprot:TRINITY_DN6939_c0_g1_i1.p1 TRINITY_DN6939_c0_g1~~TRINITY_DN6939_c0_g1_i1.p1  ORF type:complete len:273 (-),score=53.61 TRINITY_DN6939_c0_g1_i1:74-892(-)
MRFSSSPISSTVAAIFFFSSFALGLDYRLSRRFINEDGVCTGIPAIAVRYTYFPQGCVNNTAPSRGSRLYNYNATDNNQFGDINFDEPGCTGFTSGLRYGYATGECEQDDDFSTLTIEHADNVDFNTFQNAYTQVVHDGVDPCDATAVIKELDQIDPLACDPDDDGTFLRVFCSATTYTYRTCNFSDCVTQCSDEVFNYTPNGCTDGMRISCSPATVPTTTITTITSNPTTTTTTTSSAVNPTTTATSTATYDGAVSASATVVMILLMACLF